MNTNEMRTEIERAITLMESIRDGITGLSLPRSTDIEPDPGPHTESIEDIRNRAMQQERKSREDIRILRNEIKKLNNIIAELRREEESGKKYSETLNALINELKLKSKRSNEEIGQLRRLKGEMDLKLKKRDIEVATLETRLTKFDSRYKNLREENEKYSKRIKILEDENKTLTDENAELNLKCTDLGVKKMKENHRSPVETRAMKSSTD